jgi:CzcA family heavy metal efflux pump
MEKNNRDAGSEGLVSIALRNPHLIVVGCLVIVILGILSLFKLPKDLLPTANLPAVQILTFYPGMPVKDVEQNLSFRIERYTGEAIGIERQESKSLMGVSIVKNYFNSNADLNTSLALTTSLVMSVLRNLPPGTLPPLILPFDPMAAVPLALVTVSGHDRIEKIYDIARYDVRNDIQAVPGAMAPTLMGGTLREVLLYLDPQKIRNFNFSLLSTLENFSPLNTFIPMGDVKIGHFDYQIVGNGIVDRVETMNDFPLRAENGVPIYVKQIGRAEDSGQIQTNVVLIHGRQQVYVPVYRQPGANSIRVIDQVRGAIKKLETRLNGIKLELVADQSVFIRHAIASISQEALLGGGLTAVLIFLFLGNPRMTLGILISLPLSLLAAFIGLWFTGQTINAMTLGGLALSIGVLVDNSIVVLENISKKLELGKSAYNAAFEGATEVAMPVFSATLSTLVVLFPTVFLTGIVKVLFSALAKSVMFAMIASYLIAMMVIPLFASRYLRPLSQNHSSRFASWTHQSIHRLTDFYGNILTRALNYSKLVLAIAAGLLVVGLVLVFWIGTELFPRVDAGNFELDLRLASGTRIEETTAFAQKIEKKLHEWIIPHDLKMIIINAGIFYGYPAAFTPNVGTQDVFFNIELSENRQHTSQYYAKLIRERMQREFPQVEMGIQLGGLLTSALNQGLRAPINIQIEGPDLKQSYNIALSLTKVVKKLRGAVDVRVQERFDAPLINIDVNRRRAMDLGITVVEVVKNIVSAVTGSPSFDFRDLWVDPKTGIAYPMGVQFAEEHVSTFEQLASIPIQGLHRERVVPLHWVATITKQLGPIQINHVNYRPVVDVYLDAQGRDIGGLSNEVQHIIDKSLIPKGYSATIRGEIKQMKKAVMSLGGGFLLAAALVYLILVVQFRSFLLPLIIMVSVPLGLVGIVLMLVLTDTYFSIQAAIGAIFMIGIAVANGVLLIEFISYHTKANTDLNTAIITGAKVRLRPILMTSLAAILALIPMAIGLGKGSEANIPLGRAVIGGQLLSTLLTLFVMPVLYRVLMHRSQSMRSTE